MTSVADPEWFNPDPATNFLKHVPINTYIPIILSLLCRSVAAACALSRVPRAVDEERMNLIKFADFLPSWFRGFLHILLTDFSFITGAFSQFSLHNKIILFPSKNIFVKIKIESGWSPKVYFFRKMGAFGDSFYKKVFYWSISRK